MMLNTFIKKPNAALRNARGMTLIEIMIELAIIGCLIAILAGSLTDKLAKAKVKEAHIQIAEIGKALDMFYTDCGFYPESLDGLVTAPAECSTWGPDPYVKNQKKLVDPWNQKFL